MVLMEKRGVKPKRKVKIRWSSNFAYGVGLLVTDGCLSNDGRHITFVSKDTEQIHNFIRSLGIKNIKIGETFSMSSGKRKRYPRIQFGDVLFYNFLQNIGLKPAKSKTLGEINIPDRYFFDYVRGCFDGDGYTYSYWDSRWKSSFMFYLGFSSASKKHLIWLQNQISKNLHIRGHITTTRSKGSWFQLKFAKNDAGLILKEMYKRPRSIYLRRKKLKIDASLAIIRGLK